MLERDLQEWEEYDARLLDDAPAAQGAPATQRSELPHISIETRVASESPFLLGNAGETEAEMEGMEWERYRRSAHPRAQHRTGRPAPPRPPDCNCDGDGSTDDPVPDTGEYSESEGLEETETEGMAWERGARRSAHPRPRFRTGRPAPPRPPDCNCDGDGSTDDPVPVDTGEYNESEGLIETEGLVPRGKCGTTRSDIAKCAFDNSRAALRTALGHLRSLRDDIGALPSVSNPAFNNAMAKLAKHKRDIAVLSRRLMITPNPTSAEFREKLDKVIELCERNLALPFTILAAGKTGLCDPSTPLNAKGLPYAWTLTSQPDPKTHLCEPFFNSPTDLQRDVITHECFHLLGLQEISPVDNADKAMRNANTIAQIVAFLTDRSRQANSDGQEPSRPPLPIDKEVPEFETQMQAEALATVGNAESVVDEADVSAWSAELFEFDPYANIRPALRPEHASLAANELTVVLGRQPALVALHLMLDSPGPRLVTLAALLGKAGKRSIRLNGSDVPIPSYLRLLSHLCREASEQMEGERVVAEIPSAEHPFVSETFELPVAVERQAAPVAAATPDPRDLRKDAFFEDEWASTPTLMANPRNVHFSRFTTLTATGATEQTVLTNTPNPLDPRVTSGLSQPEVIPASRPKSPGELYWIYVPDAYKKAVNDAVAARKTPPVARVSVLFGVGFEVNRHGLRSFFANTADRILIEVGGVESVPEATGPWGIGITDAIVLDLLNQAVGTKVAPQVEVLAAYSTGYRGINGTINNGLIDLTHVKKMIYFDCLYRGDEPKAPSGAAMPPKRHREAPAKSAFNTWRAVQAVLAASHTCDIIVYDVTPGGTPTYSDGARKVDLPGATFIELKQLNVELKALILARLMDNGIKDGYFTDKKVPAGIRDLIPLLPRRGTLSSGALSTTPGSIGKWAKDNSTKMAQAVKGFAAAMELARTHELMGWATPPTEFGHDGFLPEFGWEHLPG